MNRCCPNAITKSRRERVGFSRNEQGGVCFPGISTRKALLLGQVLWNTPRSRTYREGTVSTIKTQAYATIWCMNMAWRCDAVWANATSIQNEWSPFESRVQMQLQIKLLYMPFIVFHLYSRYKLFYHAWNWYRWIDCIFLIIFHI